MNRGVAHQRVFFVADDGRRFERLLAEGPEMFGVEIHAYCLMGNHFHLLVRCPNSGLSEFMQRTSSLYTRHLNDRLGRDGPIFRGRFRSLLIDSPEYLDYVGRYIHRNPTDVRPIVSLDAYRWSSYRHYVDASERPDWLQTELLLDFHGGQKGYREFVEGESALGTRGLEWAIDTVVAMADEVEVSRRTGLRRTLVAATTGITTDPHSGSARRQAIYRARKRSADPIIADLIAEVWRVAA